MPALELEVGSWVVRARQAYKNLKPIWGYGWVGGSDKETHKE